MAADNLDVSEVQVVLPPIKVLHFVPGSAENAVEMVFAKRQIESLRTAGIDVSYAYFEHRQSYAGIKEGYRELTDAISKISPDLVHAHYGSITGLVAAIAKTVPLVITFRGSDINPDSTSSRLTSFANKILSQVAAFLADGIIVVNVEMGKRLWWNKEAINIIPSGVDIDNFRPSSQSESRECLGWSPDDLIVLFNAGTNSTNKRLDLAQEAVEIAKKNIPNIRLVALRANISPSEVPKFMSGADCLLMLSDFEGSPNIVKEAMACNLPVISFDVGDVRNVLDGVAGCTIVDRDMSQLTTALEETLFLKKRSDGREYIVELSTTAVARKIVDVYESILNRTK